MKKNIVLNIIFILLILCLLGCYKQTSVIIDTDDLSNEVITTVPPTISTNIPPTIVPTIVPEINPSMSEILGLATEWKTNHGNVNITVEKTDDFGDRNEYVFISPTEGWKAYIGPIGAGQEFIVLYKTTDGGKHWEKIYEPPMGGGEIVFLNSKVGWIIHNYPTNGAVELSKTLDGGITWEDERINTPTDYSDIVFGTCLPVFFSQNDGIMFASYTVFSINYDKKDLVAFITHDGGESWSLYTDNDTDEIFTWSFTWKNGSFSDFEIIYNNEEWHSINNIEWVKSPDE